MICNSRFCFTGVNQSRAADIWRENICLEALILENLLDCNGRLFSRRVEERGLEHDTEGTVADDFQVIVLDFARGASLAVCDVNFDDLSRIVKLCDTWQNNTRAQDEAMRRVDVRTSIRISLGFQTHD